MKASKKTPMEKEVTGKRRFWLAGIDTRTTFLLVREELQGTSKALLNAATVAFAGSLTFLGLRDSVTNTTCLKWAWAILAFSVLMHLFVHIAVLDGLMSHGRTETDANRATEELSGGDLIKGFFKNAFSSHHNQQLFFRSARYTILFLVMQVFSVLAGGVLMGIFVWQNL